MWNIYEIIHICTAVVDEREFYHRSKFSNLSNWKEEAWKKIGASTGFEPMTSAIPVRCSTNWAMKPHIGSKVNLLSSYLPVQWNHVKYIWNNSYLYCGSRWKWNESEIDRASHRYRGGHGFESRWSPDFFFQASSLQLLKLENLLRWSHFTFIYYRSTNMNYFIYISH